MASKKGIIATGIILAGITGASFLVWMIPESNDTTFIVSDYENYLEGEKNIYEVLQESIYFEFQNLQNGETTPEDYVAITEVTSSQLTSQISKFVTSKPPEKWQGSYINFMDGMKKFNSYIVETKVMANQIENGSSQEEINETLSKLEILKSEAEEFIRISDELRPS